MSQSSNEFSLDEIFNAITGAQGQIPYCSSGTSSGQQKKRAPQVNCNFDVKTTSPRLKQSNICWSFNDWRALATLLFSIITYAKLRSCQNWSPWPCRLLMGNLGSLNGLKTSSKQASRIITNLLKSTKANYFSIANGKWCVEHVQKQQQLNPNESGRNFSSFPWKIRQASIDGRGKAHFLDTCLQPINSKYCEFWWTLKTCKNSNRNSCSRYCWTFDICQSGTTAKEIDESGPLGKLHEWTDCQTSWSRVGVDWFGKSDELQKNIVNQYATKPIPEKPNRICHHCEITRYYRNKFRQLKHQ